MVQPTTPCNFQKGLWILVTHSQERIEFVHSYFVFGIVGVSQRTVESEAIAAIPLEALEWTHQCFGVHTAIGIHRMLKNDVLDL